MSINGQFRDFCMLGIIRPFFTVYPPGILILIGATAGNLAVEHYVFPDAGDNSILEYALTLNFINGADPAPDVLSQGLYTGDSGHRLSRCVGTIISGTRVRVKGNVLRPGHLPQRFLQQVFYV